MVLTSVKMTPEQFFEGQALSRRLFESVRDTIKVIGDAEMRVTKSQIAFCHRKTFAWVWMPGKYLHGPCAPLVLTLSLSHRDSSPRWKEIVEPSPGHFTHHLELYALIDIDDKVRSWLREAWIASR